jgi:hypothetical protein
MTPELHIVGIDPGGTTGWCQLTIPTKSIFGDEPGAIVEWDYGEFTGPEPKQAIAIGSLVRTIQSLAYKTGPALVCEDWDSDPRFKTTDPEALSPVRLGAMLKLLGEQKLLGDATLTFQGRSLAFSTATDARLKAWGLYVAGSDHIRAATRHAITMLRRAKAQPVLAAALWPYPAASLG